MGEGDRILEVGPGTGALTRLLLDRGAQVTAVELDRRLCALLREELGGREGFRLIEGDVLAGKRRLSPAVLAALGRPTDPVKVVANLPFGAATPFIVTLLEAAPGLETMVVTVQLEVADRFAAPPGSRAYGVVSVLAQTLARVEKLRRIDRAAFWPPPKVDAAVVRFTPRREDRPGEDLYARLAELVRFAFAERRKRLRGRLAARWPAGGLELLVPRDARPEELDAATYLAVARTTLRGQRPGPAS